MTTELRPRTRIFTGFDATVTSWPHLKTLDNKKGSIKEPFLIFGVMLLQHFDPSKKAHINSGACQVAAGVCSGAKNVVNVVISISLNLLGALCSTVILIIYDLFMKGND